MTGTKSFVTVRFLTMAILCGCRPSAAPASAGEVPETSISLSGVDNRGHVFAPGEAITIAFRPAEQPNQQLAFSYSIEDLRGNVLTQSQPMPLRAGKANPRVRTVAAPDRKGIYLVGVSLTDDGKPKSEKSFRIGVVPSGSIRRRHTPEESDFGISIVTSADRFLAANVNYSFVDIAGIKWNRPLIFWNLIEPKKGQYNWAVYDALLKHRREHGLALAPVIGIMNHVPQWASSSPGKTNFKDYLPKDARDVARFVGRLVGRYRHIAEHWVFDNEVNIHENTPGWNGVQNYVDCLKLSYQAAKEADPKCKIILAGVAMSDTDFIERFYQHGGKDHFDIMALHPYCSPSAPEDEVGSLFFGYALKKKGAAFPDILAARAVMKRYGDERKPIWLTELGWVEKHEFPIGKRPHWAGKVEVSELQQAQYHVRGYVLAKSYGVEKYFYNGMIDFPAGMAAHSLNRGMLSADLSPKLVFVAYCQLTSLLTGSRFERRIELGRKSLHGYLFSKGKSGIAVVWSTDATPGRVSKVDLKTGPARVSLQDMLGNNKTTTRPVNGVVSLELTGSPQYLQLAEGDLSSIEIYHE